MKRKNLASDDSRSLIKKPKLLTSKNDDSLILQLFDFHLLQNVFIQIIDTLNPPERPKIITATTSAIDEHYFISLFICCLSFSSTCKRFTEVANNTIFKAKVLHQTIDDISYSIYLKLQYFNHKYTGALENSLDNLLYLTSVYGFCNLIKPLIENGANVNYENSDGQSILHTCCISGHLKTTKEVVKYGAKIDHTDQFNCTPFSFACLHNNLDLIKFLIENGADIHHKDNWSNLPLWHCCEHGNLEVLKYLISLGSDIYHEDDNDQTLLFASCLSEDPEFIKYVLSFGLDINHLDSEDKTCLYQTAVGHQSLETTKFLISQGADLSIKYRNKTILELIQRKPVPNQQLIEELGQYF